MGTYHVLMHKKLVEKISQAPYDLIIRILGTTDFGEDDLFMVHLDTDVLSDGYHGQQEIIVTDDYVEFKRDYDT